MRQKLRQKGLMLLTTLSISYLSNLQFHTEIATREFMDDLKNLVIEGVPEKVKEKVLELLQCWASAFEKYPEYKIVGDTTAFMKMYGYEFPRLKEADAMFMADSAPEWAEGTSCFRSATLSFCCVYSNVFTDVASSLACSPGNIIAARAGRPFVIAAPIVR